MATVFLNAVLDGVTDVVRTPGASSVSWNNQRINYYSAYLGDGVQAPDDDLLDATYNISGSNWRVDYMQAAGDMNITRITDTDQGANRRIEMLKVGYNSEINLQTTKVKYLEGWEGDKHDITLGSGIASMGIVSLGAALNIVDTSAGYVSSISNYLGRGVYTVRGEVGLIGGDDLNDRLVVDGGRVGLAALWAGDDTVIVRNGGRILDLDISQGNDTVTLSDDSRIISVYSYGGDKKITLNDTLCGYLGIPRALFPEPVPCATVLGEVVGEFAAAVGISPVTRARRSSCFMNESKTSVPTTAVDGTWIRVPG